MGGKDPGQVLADELKKAADAVEPKGTAQDILDKAHGGGK